MQEGGDRCSNTIEQKHLPTFDTIGLEIIFDESYWSVLTYNNKHVDAMTFTTILPNLVKASISIWYKIDVFFTSTMP